MPKPSANENVVSRTSKRRYPKSARSSEVDTQAAIRELQAGFSDQLNYSADDPTGPIDPLTYQTPEGDSCLHIAAMRGDLRAIELLLDLGVDVNKRGDM